MLFAFETFDQVVLYIYFELHPEVLNNARKSVLFHIFVETQLIYLTS